MLSSDISHQSPDDLFSSIFIKNRKINQITEPNRSKSTAFAQALEKSQISEFSVNQADLLTAELKHGPFLQFIDDSVKFDFLGKKDFNLIGYTHPLHIKDQINQSSIDQTRLQELMDNFLHSTNLKVKNICESQTDILRKAESALPSVDKIITFEDSFYHLFKNKNDSLLFIDRELPFTQIEIQLNKYLSDHSVLLALDTQNERTFDLNQHSLIEQITIWALENNCLIWVNETYGFARHKSLFQVLNLESGFQPDYLTCGNALIGFYFLSKEQKQGFIANNKLPDLLIKNAISTLTFLEQGKFWGAKGRIQAIEHSFKEKLQQLKIHFPKHNMIYSISGNMAHLKLFDNEPQKIKSLSIKLFNQGLLVGLQKKHGKWLRFKLPTSLTNQHFDIIEKIFHNILS